MKLLSIPELNKKYGLNNSLQFIEKDELIFIEGKNKFAEFAICIQGAQVTSYKPVGSEDILWMSEKSHYQLGYPVRGGIPVCWPWFGAHPTEYEKPSHGFARRMEWDIKSVKLLDNKESIQIFFELNPNEKTKKWWPYDFKLRNIVTIGKQLEVELVTKNSGTSEFQITEALHSYFNISDISKISLKGLENRNYIDTIDQNLEKTQKNKITFESEVDRIYTDTEDECIITDPAYKRKISIRKEESNSTVVWNPWVDKSHRMSDFGDEEYQTMVCVETTNAADDIITIAPGKKHSMKAVIGLE